MFKILVVEDDKELNKSVCVFLSRSGYEATGCLDAEEADFRLLMLALLGGAVAMFITTMAIYMIVQSTKK